MCYYKSQDLSENNILMCLKSIYWRWLNFLSGKTPAKYVLILLLFFKNFKDIWPCRNWPSFLCLLYQFLCWVPMKVFAAPTQSRALVLQFYCTGKPLHQNGTRNHVRILPQLLVCVICPLQQYYVKDPWALLIHPLVTTWIMESKFFHCPVFQQPHSSLLLQ